MLFVCNYFTIVSLSDKTKIIFNLLSHRIFGYATVLQQIAKHSKSQQEFTPRHSCRRFLTPICKPTLGPTVMMLMMLLLLLLMMMMMMMTTMTTMPMMTITMTTTTITITITMTMIMLMTNDDDAVACRGGCGRFDGPGHPPWGASKGPVFVKKCR